MSVQTSASRPAGKSAGAAGVAVLVTLGIFVLVFLSFLIAPLLALGLAILVYAIMRPRSDKSPAGSSSASGQTSHGFGAGAQ